MSRRRSTLAQRRANIAALAVAAVVAVALLVLALRLLMGALRLTGPGGVTTPDPQFAEPAQTVTRPPEMRGEDGLPLPADDPSAGWEAVELTPVDKTADELGREEAAED
ncbi:MAG: hypothetical protein IKE17_01465 [Clostridia bacterium]|nr:hypothetical protein [Clostridia bacterium]